MSHLYLAVSHCVFRCWKRERESIIIMTQSREPYYDLYFEDNVEDDPAWYERYFTDQADNNEDSTSELRKDRDSASSTSSSVSNADSMSIQATVGGYNDTKKKRAEASSSSSSSSKPVRRLGRSQYSAMETHGNFGLVDTGEVVRGSRMITLHIPTRSNPTYSFDVKPGDVIHINGITREMKGKRAVLNVDFVACRQYFAPGRKVTSCTIAVPDYQWVYFMSESGGL